MPGRGTPKHGVRMPDEVWQRFGEAAEAAGVDRTILLRAFVDWYTRQPGATLPRRP